MEIQIKMLKHLLHIFFFSIICSNAIAQHEAILNTTVETHYTVKKINGLNSTYSEFSPVVYGDILLFTSDRDFDYLNWGENRWKKRKFLNVFSAKIKSLESDSAIVSPAFLYSKELENFNHTGPVAISPDGNLLVFTQVAREKHKLNKPQLYYMEKSNGKWGNKQLFSFCDPEFSFGHPAFSADGKRLFFSSDMKGSMGGKDVFYVEKTTENWSAPVNPGSMINSSGDEVFPYVHQNALYFSSSSQGGEGGLDLFKSYFRDSLFTKAENLGNEINSKGDDFGFFILPNRKGGFFSSNREGGKGDDDIYYVKIEETAVVGSKDIVGRFSYRTLNSGTEGLDVLLIDDNGEIVMRTKTDNKGEFAFRNLPANENYSIRVINPDPDLKLEIIDRDGVAVAVLRSDQNGTFVYKKLDPALSGTLSLMEIEETELGKKSGRLSGQFIFEKLPGVYPDGLNVYLVDDQGNVVHRSKTDNYGNFTFRELDLGKNYILKTDSTGEDVILLIYNKSENVTAELRRNSNGEYVFRKLTPEAAGLRFMEISDDTSMLAKPTVSLAGQFRYRNLDGSPSNMNFVIIDDKGNVLYKGSTDEKGFFRVRNLKIAEEYIFQIDPNDPNFEKKLILDLYNRTGRSLAMLENDKTGRFTYKRLKQEFSYLQEISTTDMEFLEKVPNIYFEKNHSDLSADSKKTLDKVFLIMTKHKKLKLQISGYADSRYNEDFNLALSAQRAKAAKAYLVSKGISASRINVQSYGESRLVNGCSDGVDCEEEQHRMNRRCEFRLEQSSK